LDREWTPNDIEKLNAIIFPEYITDLFPPSMVALRRKSRLYRKAIQESVHTPQRILDNAIEQTYHVDRFMSESEWFGSVQSIYHKQAVARGLTVTHVISPSPLTGIWTLTHSTEFGGYIGCLTFAHLVPYPIHSPICPLVMTANFECRISGDSADESKCSKIPIEGVVYKLIGLSHLI
jgi:hypothetical protein